MSTYQLRVELLYGHSPHPVACFWPGSPSGSISVGARGAWRVEAPGVADYVAYLYSDGMELFVTSIDPASPVSVNGKPLIQGYCAIRHGDTVDFGQARLTVSAVHATAENYVAPPEPIGEGPPPPPFVLAPAAAPMATVGGTVPMDVVRPNPAEKSAPDIPFVAETRAVDLAELRNLAPALGESFAAGLEPVPSELPPTRVVPPAEEEPGVPGDTGKSAVREMSKNPWTQASLVQKCILVLLPFSFVAVWFVLGPGKKQPGGSTDLAGATSPGEPAQPRLRQPQEPSAVKPAPGSSAEVPLPAASSVSDDPEKVRDVEPKRALPESLEKSVASSTKNSPLDGDGLTAERRAADALISGDFAAALEKYQDLASEGAENQAYAAAARIIAQRLKAGSEDSVQ